MLKKILPFTMSVVLVLSLVSCGKTPSSSQDPSTSSPPDHVVPDSVMNMVWAAGPTSGVTYPLGAAVSELISSQLAPGAQITLLEGTSGGNIELVNSGDALMGHTMGDTAFCAMNGLEPFDSPKTDFRTWARVSDFQFQFVIPESLGVSSFEEIKEKNIKLNLGTNTYGSSAEMCTRLVLEAYGITYEWIEENGGSITFTGFSDGVTLMQDGHINAWGALSAAPNSFIQEMSMSQPMTILPVSQEVMEQLAASNGYAIGTIPANSYDGITEEIPTLLSPMVLIVSAGLDDDFVYELTKNFFTDEMKENLLAVSTTFGNVSPEYSSQNLGAPLHPGAERFYQEMNVLS